MDLDAIVMFVLLFHNVYTCEQIVCGQLNLFIGMHPRSSRCRYLCVKNATKYLEGNIYTMREIIRSRDSGILFRLFSFNMKVIFEKYMTFFVNLKVMFRLYGHFLTSLEGYSTYHYNSSNGINSWET